MSTRNGRRPRTPSHAVPDGPPPGPDARTPPGPIAGASGPSEAVAGLLGGQVGGQGEPDVSHVTNVGGGGHTTAGKFAPGNRFGRGNPQARRHHEFRMQFLDAIAEGTIPMLAKRLQIAALGGDLDSTKILLDYCLGKPAAAVELSGPNGEPLGVNFHAVTAIVLDALAGDPARRIEVAARLMELDDVRDADDDA